jgi:hypothetical protein
MEKLTGSTCKSLMEAYAAVYDTARSKLEEEQINEFNDFINLLIDEGYDLSEYTYDELYEGWKEKVLKTTLKYGGKALEAGKGALKTLWKGTTQQTPKGIKTIPGAKQPTKALLATFGNLGVKVGAPLAGAAALDQAFLGGNLRRAAGEYTKAGIEQAKKSTENIPSPQKAADAIKNVKPPELPKLPATASLKFETKPSTPPKPEKPKEKTTSRLYEKVQEPLTVSGGRTGTGVGKKFKPRPWTQAEVERYKKTRGAEQIKTDIQLNKDVAAMNRQTAATPPGRDPETYRPPSPTQRPPAATKPAPTRQAPAPAQTGDRAKDTATWAKANPQLAARVTPAGTQRGTGQSTMAKQAAELRGMQKASQERQAAQSGPMYSSSDVKSKMSSRTKTMLGLKDSYDIVLDYLLSQRHVDTLEEALYVMMEMDSKCIQSIIEGVMPEPIDPTAHKEAQRLARQQGKVRALEAGATTPGEQKAAQSKLRGPQLPGV